MQGRDRLADYCASRGITFKELGKLIVAPTPSQLPALDALDANAAACGVMTLQRLSGDDAVGLEPELAGGVAGALLSPRTAVFDTHAYCAALLADAEGEGATFAPRCAVVGGKAGIEGGGVEVDVAEGEATTTPTLRIKARAAVFAAGLGSNRLLAKMAGLPPLPRQRIAAGRYCRLTSRHPPFSRLIYPLPVDGGLGVHATLDWGDTPGTRFGPDVEWWSAEEAGSGDATPLLGPSPPDVPPSVLPAFEAAIRTWWPSLPPASLAVDYTGLRPKLCGPGNPPADFFVRQVAPGVAIALGIESPGLTASLALADVIVAALDE